MMNTKFSKSPQFRKKFHVEVPLFFVDICITLKHSVGLVERSLHAKNQINPSIPFDRTPTCDRQTQTQGRSYSTRASIASRE